MRAGTALLAGLAMIASSSTMALEALPDDFFLVTISNASDDNLNAARIACAFGDIPKIIDRIKSQNIDTQIVAETYCPAVVAEAIQRGNDVHLYVRMQHEKANEEMKLTLLAAAGDKPNYVDASGKVRAMTCELAFDIGFIYGDTNRGEAILTNLTEADIQRHITRCYEQLVEVSIQQTFWVAARYAQDRAKLVAR